ncbi:TldD/PmbA family protein [Gloeobacter kilaueensis]|uniref:Peptidase U62 modulator of DNA gyrase n=1 Tax=Gloeobacter kilaueensis (strain ATCC BAA-2537 / CCAP 1431/1 / ULC 316 / JS1) TaxID=1183438 RepID=U5QLM8_GLOK1|nr:TldD/PmbA family protein [Gloeobacter kilaueensis]AGY59801.1 peptidase U62 modulator of DNA gyrase [Gloeobacter kilaueensis JS1]
MSRCMLPRREFLWLLAASGAVLAPERLRAAEIAQPLVADRQKVKELCEAALKAARTAGADFADIRLMRNRQQILFARNDRLAQLVDTESYGFGIRCLYRGAWGFASSSIVTPASAIATAKRAVEIAKASALAVRQPVKLAPEPPHRGEYVSPRTTNSFDIPIAQKTDLLLTSTERMRKVQEVKVATGFLYFLGMDKYFASSDGSFIHIDSLISNGSINAQAAGNGDQQSRGYEISALQAGWEHILKGDLVGNADRVANEARLKLTAAEAPTGKRDLILDGEHLHLTIHESIGHATELDRALGYEADYAGTTFATPDKLGKLKYGSRHVNVVADNTLPGGLASMGYDDEGVAAQKWDIIREGVLMGYSSNREVAPQIGESRSHGSCRCDSWEHIPIVRIANVGMDPNAGSGSPEDLIADTRDGILIEGTGTWSIDQTRLNFQFGGDLFYRIRNGKKAEMLKDVVYRGITPEFWGACDGVCGKEHWRPWGVLTCGKGQPGQAGRMTHGAAPARFRQIDVGSGNQAQEK